MTMVEPTHAHPAESALVVEEGNAQRIQAQFTRLQMALGLKESFSGEDLEKLVYGTQLRAPKFTQPTGFDTKDDVAIISLDTRTKFEGDRLVEFTWAARFLDSAILRGASLREYAEKLDQSRAFSASHRSQNEGPHCGIQEPTLAAIRRAINNIFEPLCCGFDGKQIERTDGQSYDHTRHKTCTPRKQVVLLLPDKEKCLCDLKILGCDPQKSLQLIDIVDMREIFQAYLVRKDYSCRSSMAGKHRTVLHHDWEDLPLASQIIPVLEHDVTTRDTNDQGDFQNLAATVVMAWRDSGSRCWLRTREQVDGGAYPGPWLQLRSRREVEAFLIEYDLTRAHHHSVINVSAKVEALTDSMWLLSPSIYDGFILKLARAHGYTHLLDKFVTPSNPVTSSAATNSTPSESAGAESVQKLADKCSTQPIVGTTGSSEHHPTVSKSNPAKSIQKSTDQPSTQPSVETARSSPQSATPSKPAKKPSASTSTKARPDESSADTFGSSTIAHVANTASVTPAKILSANQLHELCTQYHDDQKHFEQRLWLFGNHRAHSDKTSHFDSFFKLQSDKRHTISHGHRKVFRMIREIQEKILSPDIATLLSKMIAGRERAMRHYQSLSGPNRRRRKKNKGHLIFLNILKAGGAVLFGQGFGKTTSAKSKSQKKA